MKKLEKSDIRIVIERALNYYQIQALYPFEDRNVLMLIPKDPVGLIDVCSEYALLGLNKTTVLFFERCADIPSGLADFKVMSADSDGESGKVFSALTGFTGVEILTPSTEFLRKLADGADDKFVKAATYFLLSGKSCIVRTPYSEDHIKSGNYSRKMKALIRELWDMGVTFSGMSPDINELTAEDGAVYDFVGEKDVINASQKGLGHILICENSVVTPLALERAREMNIQIISKKEGI